MTEGGRVRKILPILVRKNLCNSRVGDEDKPRAKPDDRSPCGNDRGLVCCCTNNLFGLSVKADRMDEVQH